MFMGLHFAKPNLQTANAFLRGTLQPLKLSYL